MNPMTFHDACAAHDWYHDWSEDSGVWSRGQRDRARLREAAEQTAGLGPIWEAWNAYAYSGRAFGTPKAARPDRPTLADVSTFGGGQPPLIPGQLSIFDNPTMEHDRPRKRRVMFGEAA